MIVGDRTVGKIDSSMSTNDAAVVVVAIAAKALMAGRLSSTTAAALAGAIDDVVVVFAVVTEEGRDWTFGFLLLAASTASFQIACSSAQCASPCLCLATSANLGRV